MESGLITPSALIRTGAAKGVTSGLRPWWAGFGRHTHYEVSRSAVGSIRRFRSDLEGLDLWLKACTSLARRELSDTLIRLPGGRISSNQGWLTTTLLRKGRATREMACQRRQRIRKQAAKGLSFGQRAKAPSSSSANTCSSQPLRQESCQHGWAKIRFISKVIVKPLQSHRANRAMAPASS
jgi:hypothetical protein